MTGKREINKHTVKRMAASATSSWIQDLALFNEKPCDEKRAAELAALTLVRHAYEGAAENQKNRSKANLCVCSSGTFDRIPETLCPAPET